MLVKFNNINYVILRLRQSTIHKGYRWISYHQTTIDGKEVTHFKRYTATWWDEMGEMKPLHSMNKLRVPFIRDGLINSSPAKLEFVESPQPLKHLNLLDVGCGGGLLSEPLARLGCNIVGIDVTDELIDIAKEHAQFENLSNITYLLSSVENHASKNAELYDAVIASEVIEHVNDKSRFVAECVKCLKPGGSIFFTTLNKTLLAQIGAVFIPENLLRFIPEGTHDLEKFIEPHVLQRLLEDNQCRTRLIHGMFYNYFTNSWCWMTDTSICYALHAVRY